MRRYLSTPLVDDEPADMTAAAQALADRATDTVAHPQPQPEPTDARLELSAKEVPRDEDTVRARAAGASGREPATRQER